MSTFPKHMINSFKQSFDGYKKEQNASPGQMRYAKAHILHDFIEEICEGDEEAALFLYTVDKQEKQIRDDVSCMVSTSKEIFMPMLAGMVQGWKEEKNSDSVEIPRTEAQQALYDAFVNMHLNYQEAGNMLFVEKELSTEYQLAVRQHMGYIFALGRIICEQNNLPWPQMVNPNHETPRKPDFSES